MLSVEQIVDWRGQAVFDSAGERLGKLSEVYYDRASGLALLGSVSSGLFGRRATLVPLDRASAGRDFVRVAYPADTVKLLEGVEIAPTLSDDTLGRVRSVYGVRIESEMQVESAALLDQRREEAEKAATRADALEREALRAAEDAKTARGRADEAAAAADAAERAVAQLRDEAAAAREAETAARELAGRAWSGED
jgi:hypothetical protein